MWCGSPCYCGWPIPSSHVFAHDTSRQQQFEGQGQSGFYQEEGTPLRCFNHNAQCIYGNTWQAEANIALLSAQEDEVGKVHLSTESWETTTTQSLLIIQAERAGHEANANCRVGRRVWVSDFKNENSMPVHGGEPGTWAKQLQHRTVCECICSSLEDSWGATRTVDLDDSLWREIWWWRWVWSCATQVAKRGVLSSLWHGYTFWHARCRFRTRGDRIKSVPSIDQTARWQCWEWIRIPANRVVPTAFRPSPSERSG